jgi:high affinity Mn2+ porin
LFAGAQRMERKAIVRKILKNPLLALLFLAPASLYAQTSPESATTVFPHTTTEPFWVAGQANFIYQEHSAFHAPYSGVNSLRPESEHALSRVLTIYTGYQFNGSTEILFDLESAGGKGISDAFGLAGFTNLDVVRNPTLGSRPYVSRLMLHTVIPFGTERERQERGPLSVLTDVPVRRLELRAGKFGTVDFFDLNGVGSDSHLQFLNWTVDDNGAYDYAADTRGYTVGAIAEFHDRAWSIRGGLMQMPAVANGIRLDDHVRQEHGENVELELRPALVADRATTARFLVYENHARMGSYAEAIDAFRAGIDPTPDITAHRAAGRTKKGVGFSAEQELTTALRAFGRLGWSDGRNESFAYTEVDRTAEIGADWKNPHRANDKIGVAVVVNRLSDLHRQYLQLGGLGFLLGDGTLRYGPERIIEAYYTASFGRGFYLSTDVQSIRNPGYNRDRGPVLVPALRLHVDL